MVKRVEGSEDPFKSYFEPLQEKGTKVPGLGTHALFTGKQGQAAKSLRGLVRKNIKTAVEVQKLCKKAVKGKANEKSLNKINALMEEFNRSNQKIKDFEKIVSIDSNPKLKNAVNEIVKKYEEILKPLLVTKAGAPRVAITNIYQSIMNGAFSAVAENPLQGSAEAVDDRNSENSARRNSSGKPAVDRALDEIESQNSDREIATEGAYQILPQPPSSASRAGNFKAPLPDSIASDASPASHSPYVALTGVLEAQEKEMKDDQDRLKEVKKSLSIFYGIDPETYLRTYPDADAKKLKEEYDYLKSKLKLSEDAPPGPPPKPPKMW